MTEHTTPTVDTTADDALRGALYEAWRDLALIALDGEYLTDRERGMASEALCEALYEHAMTVDVSTVDAAALRREMVSHAVSEAIWAGAAIDAGAEYDDQLVADVVAVLAAVHEPVV